MSLLTTSSSVLLDLLLIFRVLKSIQSTSLIGAFEAFLSQVQTPNHLNQFSIFVSSIRVTQPPHVISTSLTLVSCYPFKA